MEASTAWSAQLLLGSERIGGIIVRISSKRQQRASWYEDKMVPRYVKLVVGLASTLVLTRIVVLGLRDVFAPGKVLPFDQPEGLLFRDAIFGAPPLGACGKKEKGCVPGRMLLVSQGWGAMAATLALVKLVAVFSHPEGTFLRRNLFATLGGGGVAFAAIIYSHEPYFNSQGASGMTMAFVFAVEGLVLLYDALLRPRATKKLK